MLRRSAAKSRCSKRCSPRSKAVMKALPLALLVALAMATSLLADDAKERQFFNDKILPVLKKHCFECHAKEAEEVKGGLRLDSRAALRMGGDSGEIIKPGEPDDSLLIKVLRYAEDDRQMPPRGKLDQAIIDDFVNWVKQGAVDPRDP
jgi:mono/diheme cytochrome c family protein